MELRLDPPVLLFVAHWDDETLNAGGAMLRYGKGWDVCSATVESNRSHYEHVFEALCDSVSAKAVTLPIHHRLRPFDARRDRPEKYGLSVPRTRLTASILRHGMRDVIDPDKYATVITHHINGDLGGHPQHTQIADAATELFPKAAIYHFVALPEKYSKECTREDALYYLQLNATHILDLDRDEAKGKHERMHRYSRPIPTMPFVFPYEGYQMEPRQ